MSEPPSISLEPGECVTLSPESSRFKGVYQQITPRSADEVRELLGLTGAAAEAVAKSRTCCLPGSGLVATPAAEDLEAKDAETRVNARRRTYDAFYAYVYGSDTSSLVQLKPAFDRYLGVFKAIINVVLLLDIEVADGATLTISPSTHVLRARNIIIHNTGRIVCQGSTTFKIVSLKGDRPKPAYGPVAAATSFQTIARH
jgi:hypothetical protein